MKNENIIGWVILAIVLVALGYGLFSAFGFGNKSNRQYDEFAQCLASKKVTMYGASWCPHCQREKSNFGMSFKYVPYVECPENQKLCLDKGIAGYPTWMTADGTKYEGEQGLEGLAKISGCPLVSNN